jgi:hypothetical protein
LLPCVKLRWKKCSAKWFFVYKYLICNYIHIFSIMAQTFLHVSFSICTCVIIRTVWNAC